VRTPLPKDAQKQRGPRESGVGIQGLVICATRTPRSDALREINRDMGPGVNVYLGYLRAPPGVRGKDVKRTPSTGLSRTSTRDEPEETVSALLVSILSVHLLRAVAIVARSRVERHRRNRLQALLRLDRNVRWVVRVVTVSVRWVDIGEGVTLTGLSSRVGHWGGRRHADNGLVRCVGQGRVGRRFTSLQR
jgi:hypothetical protein